MSEMLGRVVTLWAMVAWLVFGAGSYTTTAATTDISGAGERAFADVAACVATADTLLVSTVVDQSGSLRNTDPSNQRVGAVDTAVDALFGLRETAEGELDVQMNLAVFDGGYEEIVGWGSLSGDHPGRLRETAAEELPQRNTGEFTDYRAALRGAQEGLRERSLSVDGEACKVVLWFTDGRFDVGDDTDAAVEQLCAPQGIADGLRGENISVIALALFTSAGQGAVASEDAELLRAVAEGQGDGTECGTVPIPENYSSGAYLHAADADALRRVFAGAGTMIEGGQQALTATCPGEDCVDGQFRVPLDPGLSGFRLVLDGVREDAPPALLSPDGETAELTSGDQVFAGAELSASTRDGLTVVDLSFPSGGSPGGSWILDTQATPERISVVDLYYFWGVGLEIRAPDGLTIGESSTLEAVLTYPDGTPVEPDPFQSLRLDMTVDGENVALSPAGPGTFRGQFDVPGQGASSALNVSVVAEAVSSPSSVRLGPITASSRMSTALPPAFASLLTSELSMPQIVGEGGTGGVLEFRGSERGVTQACIDELIVSGPETAGDVAVTTEETCLEIPADALLEWPVDVVPAQPADGRIEGSITLSMTAVDGVDTITVEVPFSASMMRPVNEPLRWALVALLVFVGLLVPVLIAWLTNYFNGTYRVSSRTVQAQKHVKVTARGLAPHDGRSLLNIDDFAGLQVSGNQRRAKIDGMVQLRRRLPWWPFSDVTYEAVSRSSDRMLLSSREPYSRGAHVAPAESNIRGVFFLDVELPSEPADEYDGWLVIFDEEDPDLTSVIQRRTAQVDDFRDWPALMSTIAEEIERRTDKVERPRPTARSEVGPDRPVVPPSEPETPAAEPRPSLWDEPAGGKDQPTRSRDLWGGDGERSSGRPGPRSDSSDKPPSIFDD